MISIYRNTRKNFHLLIIIVLFSLLTFDSISSIPLKNINETLTKEKLTSRDQDEDSSTFFGLYNMFGGGNPSKTSQGQTIVEGDIVLPSIATNKQLNNDLNEIANTNQHLVLSERKAVPDSSLYWPDGEVIYTYHESINQMEMSVIEAAMRHWSQHTCIRFRQRQPNDYVFVRFRSDTQGCWSLVGRQVNSPNGFGQGQDVSIGQGCANLNVVVHEIGHVIGFYHEQSRSDRDQYIEIVWSNVLPGYALQFRKESDTSFQIPYDLTSTMQYPQWAFSKEIFEKSTIVAKNPAYQRFLSKNYPLSFRDRLIANQMYQCTSSCGGGGGYGSSAVACQNGGYMRATASAGSGGGGYGSSSSSCSCDCPPNYTGPNCETALRSDYYEELPCGGTVTQEGAIETPGFPQRTAPGQSCMWNIQAPPNHRVSLKFKAFEFAPRFTKPGTKVINKCFNETVEIRLRNGNIYDGDTYCGNDIAPGTVLRSDGPKAVIIITANDKMIGQGLSAKVKFFREGTMPVDDQDDEDDNQEKQTTPRPLIVEPTTTTMATTTTSGPIVTEQPEIVFTTPNVVTLPPNIIAQTLPPQPSPPPPPPPPPSVVTTSSLLEEYEKESKKTYPPVGPFSSDENKQR